jgi:hypothetical protein
MLSHDAQGFLTGTVIPEIRRAVELLERIRSDVAAIKRAFQSPFAADAEPNARPPANQSRPAEPEPATPPLRGRRRSALPPQDAAEPPPSGGGAQSQSGSGSNTLPPGNETAEPSPRRRRLSRSPEPHERDAQGRFTNNHQNSGGRGNQNSDEDEKKQKRLFDGLGDRLAEAVTGSASSLEEVDPTVKAFNEVAQPLARGYQWLAGGDKETRWYRRIWRELKLFRGDQTVFNRAEQRVLNEISENTENPGSGNSGSGGGVLSMLAAMLGLGAGRSAAGGLGRVLGGVGRGLLRGAGGALRFGGKLLRRLPLIGGLFAGAGAAADVYGNETDDTLTRQEKDIRNGNAIGGAAGTVGGMMAGAAAGSLLGPVGTVIGGLVGAFLGDQGGQIIGEKIGEWTNSLREYDLPGKVMALWNNLTDSFQVGWEDIKKKWGDFVDKAVEGWEQFTALFESAYEGMKKLPVIGPAIQAAEDMAKAAKKAVTDLAEKGIEEAKKLPEKAKETLNQGVEWLKENTTLGKSMQAIKEVVESEGKTRVYTREDGSQETRTGGSRSWRNNNPGNLNYGDFAKRMGAIGSDGRFAIFPTYEAGRKAKEDLIFNGKNYKDLSLSEAIARYAPPSENNTSNYQKTALAAVGGKEKRMRDYSPEERLAILDAIETKEGFKVGSVSITGGSSLNRAPQENAQVLSLASMESLSQTLQMPAAPVMALPPAPPSIPPLQAAPTVSDAPIQQITPYPVESARKNLNVSIDRGDVGRDLSERRLAHIVTGGLSD